MTAFWRLKCLWWKYGALQFLILQTERRREKIGLRFVENAREVIGKNETNTIFF